MIIDSFGETFQTDRDHDNSIKKVNSFICSILESFECNGGALTVVSAVCETLFSVWIPKRKTQLEHQSQHTRPR